MASKMPSFLVPSTFSRRAGRVLVAPGRVASLQARSSSGATGSTTPYRFRFLLHTEEFAEKLAKRTTDEALGKEVLGELASLNRNRSVVPTIDTSFSELKLDTHEIQVLRYDLADKFGFYVPIDEPMEKFNTGRDVVAWVKEHTNVLRQKASGVQRFEPRNMTGGL